VGLAGPREEACRGVRGATPLGVIKILEATVLPRVLYCVRSSANVISGGIMKERTCAACDCALDANAVKVTIGGKTVDVCCDECAQKLREPNAGFDAPGRA
jgi:hypothetical protein